MTDQEVLARGTELRLIWVTNRPPGTKRRQRQKDGIFDWHELVGFRFDADINNSPASRVSLFFRERWNAVENYYSLTLTDTSRSGKNFQGAYVAGSLHCSLTDPTVRPSPIAREQFVTEWTPLFRRNCWLSGVPLECSATERMEWTLYGRVLGLSEKELRTLLTP